MQSPAIAHLPPRQLEIVELICGHDLTTDEIAHQFGISPHSVKNQRAAIMLRFGSASMHRVCAIYGMYLERLSNSDILDALGDGRAMRANEV